VAIRESCICMSSEMYTVTEPVKPVAFVASVKRATLRYVKWSNNKPKRRPQSDPGRLTEPRHWCAKAHPHLDNGVVMIQRRGKSRSTVLATSTCVVAGGQTAALSGCTGENKFQLEMPVKTSTRDSDTSKSS